MINYVIIKAKDEHSEQVVDLIFNIWVNEYSFNVKIEDYPDLRHIKAYYHDKGGTFLIAITNEEIVGTIACDSLNEYTYVLKRMFMKSNFRGQGIAQVLLDRLLESFTPGVSFFLSTKQDLAYVAKRLYLRNGFQIVDKNVLPVGFPYFYEDDLFMRKIL